jgi:predicted O-methyltransferase YrrM
VAQGQPLNVLNASVDDLYRHVLAAYEQLGYPAGVVNSWAISYNDVPDLIAAAQRAKPRKILEVGTYVGVSTMLLALVCPEASIVTVDPDLPLETEMETSGSATSDVDATATTQAIAKAAADILGLADRIRFVKGGFAGQDTFSSSLTTSGIKTELVGPEVCREEGPFDFVFIDGLHTTEAVAADLALASSHLASTGLIALHDCVGFWGANVRAGVLDFLRHHPRFRFQHPPFASLWRTLGTVAPVGSKLLDRGSFSVPQTRASRPAALGETFATVITTVFGDRNVLEVAVGEPLLRAPQDRPDAYQCVRVLTSRTTQNLNADLDRILSQFDKLENPVLCSADLLDFAPGELVQNLLAAIAHRKGAMFLGLTPPGEVGIAGPESRPVSWLIDCARGKGLTAYAPASLDLEPAKYSLFSEMRELGRNSRLASFIALTAGGPIVDGKGRSLSELSPETAVEREQAELQRVHLAAGYRRYLAQTNEVSRLMEEQSRDLHAQIREAVEAGQREKKWREENAQSYTSHVASVETALVSIRSELDATAKRELLLSSHLDAVNAHAKLERELREGREKNLLRILEENAEQERQNERIQRDNEAANRAHLRTAQEAADRYKAELETLRNEHQILVSSLTTERDTAHATAEAVQQDLSQARKLVEDYSSRLIEAYGAIDAFDSLVTRGEAALSSGDFAAGSTAAELYRLQNRWHSLLARVKTQSEDDSPVVRSLLLRPDKRKSKKNAIGAGGQSRSNKLGFLPTYLRRISGGKLGSILRRVSAMRRGRSVIRAKARLDAELSALGLECPAFDAEFYRSTYGDVPAGQELRHYLAFGEREGRRPLQKFDPSFYLSTYPDIRDLQKSPLVHFLSHGLREGRSPCADLHPLVELAQARGMTPLEFFVRS